MGKINYINIAESDSSSPDKKTLFKYMSLSSALSLIQDKSLWFANPKTWKDPFESRFMNAQYQSQKGLYDCPWVDRVFCSCFTQTPCSEAFWVTRASNELLVRLTIDKEVLKEGLNHLANSGFDVYVGAVDYCETKNITGSLSQIKFGSPYSGKIDVADKDFFARLMLLKRNAFRYEDELRVLLFADTAINRKGVEQLIKHGLSKSLVTCVQLPPNIGKEASDFLKQSLASMEVKIEQSHLYDDFYGKTIIKY